MSGAGRRDGGVKRGQRLLPQAPSLTLQTCPSSPERALTYSGPPAPHPSLTAALSWTGRIWVPDPSPVLTGHWEHLGTLTFPLPGHSLQVGVWTRWYLTEEQLVQRPQGPTFLHVFRQRGDQWKWQDLGLIHVLSSGLAHSRSLKDGRGMNGEGVDKELHACGEMAPVHHGGSTMLWT